MMGITHVLKRSRMKVANFNKASASELLNILQPLAQKSHSNDDKRSLASQNESIFKRAVANLGKRGLPKGHKFAFTQVPKEEKGHTHAHTHALR